MTQNNKAVEAILALQGVVAASGKGAELQAKIDPIIDATIIAMVAEKNLTVAIGTLAPHQQADVLAAMMGMEAVQERTSAAALPVIQAFVATLPVDTTAAAAASNGKLYTEEDVTNMKAEMKNEILKELVAMQAAAQQVPAATATVPPSSGAAVINTAAGTVTTKQGTFDLSTWEYVRVNSASGVRMAGDGFETMFQFLGDVVRDGMYGVGAVGKTSTHYLADFIDVRPERKAELAGFTVIRTTPAVK